CNFEHVQLGSDGIQRSYVEGTIVIGTTYKFLPAPSHGTPFRQSWRPRPRLEDSCGTSQHCLFPPGTTTFGRKILSLYASCMRPIELISPSTMMPLQGPSFHEEFGTPSRGRQNLV